VEVLEVVQSPSHILEIVRTWPHLKTRGIAVDGCVVKKVRPTDEGALELEYQLKLVNARTAEPFKTTLLGEIYPAGKGEKKHRKLLESLEGKEQFSAEPNLRHFVLYVPELSLLLRSPCMDEKLPGLDVALDAEAMKPLLARYLEADTAGRESIRASTIETLRYRVGKRYILRYALETVDAVDGRTHQRSFIGKMYSDPVLAAHVFTTMQQMVEHGFGRDAGGGIRIPHPYGYVDELQMIVMEDVSGWPLSEDLSSPHLVDDLQAAARALIKIHRCPVKQDSQHHEKTDREYQREERIAALAEWMAKAIQVHPEAKSALQEAFMTIVALDHDLDGYEPTLIHGSFSLREVLVGDLGVAIVDLDRLCNGDPALDLGKLLANLKHKGNEQGQPAEAIHRYAEAFLAAYDPQMPSELLPRTDYYYRACLLRTACRCSLQPKKQHLVAELLDEAMRGLTHS
jgi:hypothetical protein